MLGDNARRALLEVYGRGVLQSCALINLDSEPLKPYDMPLTNPSLRYTKMRYYIRYIPALRVTQKKRKKKYVIYSDLIERTRLESFRFDTWEEVEEEAKHNKEIRFLLEYTNLNKNLIDILERNLMFDFPLLFDYERYEKTLRDKIEERTGVRPDYSMFIDPALLDATNEPFRDWMTKYNKEL